MGASAVTRKQEVSYGVTCLDVLCIVLRLHDQAA
jgi:hypothetical protein